MRASRRGRFGDRTSERTRHCSVDPYRACTDEIAHFIMLLVLTEFAAKQVAAIERSRRGRGRFDRGRIEEGPYGLLGGFQRRLRRGEFEDRRKQ